MMDDSAWHTPLASDSGEKVIASSRHGRGLLQQADRWPTPTVMDTGDTTDLDRAQERRLAVLALGVNRNGFGPSLGEAARMWPTPAGRDFTNPNASPFTTRAGRSPAQEQLPNFVVHYWRTPQAMDAERGSNSTWVPKPRAGQHSLRHQIEKWPTPRAHDSGPDFASFHRLTENEGKNLQTMAALWQTPSVAASEGGQASRSGERSSEPLLAGQAAALTDTLWKTPRTVAGGYTRDKGNPDLERLTLDGQASAFLLSSHQALPTSRPGPTSSPGTRSLNPLFVCNLMGWPPGWSILARGPIWPVGLGSISCGCSATGWFLYRARMRSALLAMPLPEDPKPQLSLFD